MRYQVPQFIEIEDKIFGPLTIKQFLYVAGGSAIAFMVWTTFRSFIAIIIATPILIFSFALAFYKVNNRPFIATVESAIKYFFNSKLYIWHKKPRQPEKASGVGSEEDIKMSLPKMSSSKLKELAWSLDINQNLEKAQPPSLGSVENESLNLKL